MIRKLNKIKESTFSNWTYLIFAIALCLLILVLPIVNKLNLANSTISSKTIFFIKSLIIVSFIWLTYILFSKSEILQFKISKIDGLLFVLVCYFLINRYVIQIHYGFSFRFIELIGLSFFYLILRTIPIKIYPWLFLSILISGTIQAVYGNLQLLGFYSSNHSGFKITGSFFNPGPYAGFLASVFPVALGLYLFEEKVTNCILFNIKNKYYLASNTIIKYVFKYFPLVGITSIILVIIAAQSRASWLAILISSMILLELRYNTIKNNFNKFNKIKKIILITGSVLIAGISFFSIYHFKKGSSDGRLFIWKISTEIIKDNPFFGIGFDRFKAHYMNYQASYFLEYGETEEVFVAGNTQYAFNEFIQFITENGIVGFILFISILYFIFKVSTIKENNYLSVIMKISLLSIAVFAFFSYPMVILPIKFIMIILIAGLAKLDQGNVIALENFKIRYTVSILKNLTVVVGLIIIVFSANHIIKLKNSFKNWQFAQGSYKFGDYESALQEYEAAYPEFKKNGKFLMNYGKALSVYGQDKKAIKILKRAKMYSNTTVIETALGDAYKNTKQYENAENAYKHAFNMIPCRFYPLYLLAKLYDKNNEKEKAVTMAKTILNKEVKIPSKAIEEMQQEMKNLIKKINY